MSLRVALVVSLVICASLTAQVPETEAPPASRQEATQSLSTREVAIETAKQPSRKLKVVTESVPGYIPKYSNANGDLTESILSDSGGTLTVSGNMVLPNARLSFNYLVGGGGDVTGAFDGAEMLSFGFNNRAPFTGTLGDPSGRTLYFYDRVAAAYRAVVDGQGTWWIGSSATNFGLKVLAPTGSTAGITIDSSGKVGIGTPPDTNYRLKVAGDTHFAGTVTGTNIKAHYQDIAEWVPSTTDLSPGTVVVLNRERNNQVMASATAYDITVAGVVSAQPGLSLGIESEGKEQIATTGRVRVRVDARTKPVRVGDLLVTSGTSGAAMSSEPMDINGRKFHQPGTIIGKALEPLEGGIDEILVLLSMQ